jgi:hypothetical protein
VAKVKLNPILEQIRGQVGDLVFKKYGEGVIISRKPDMEGVEPTEAQLAQRERFREGVLYGKMVVADPEAKALYDEVAQAKGKPVFSLMVADFFNAPSVGEVDLAAYAGGVGDEIVIRADDDFDVANVYVTVADIGGNALESGEAAETPAESGRWVYAAQASVPTGTTVRIAVTAADRPGGTGEAAVEKML